VPADSAGNQMNFTYRIIKIPPTLVLRHLVHIENLARGTTRLLMICVKQQGCFHLDPTRLWTYSMKWK